MSNRPSYPAFRRGITQRCDIPRTSGMSRRCGMPRRNAGWLGRSHVRRAIWDGGMTQHTLPISHRSDREDDIQATVTQMSQQRHEFNIQRRPGHCAGCVPGPGPGAHAVAVTRQSPTKGKGTELPAWRNRRHPCRLAGNGVRRALGAAGGIVGISDQDDGVVMTRWLRVRRRGLHSRTCAPVSWRQLNAWQAHETRASVEAESRQRTFDGAMTAPASTLWKIGRASCRERV